MVRVTVPATSANMGSGYDSIGIALELYNVIDLAENDHIDISDKNGQYVPQDESNLIYQCAKRVYDECGKPLSGLTIVEDCAIPQTRGLGPVDVLQKVRVHVQAAAVGGTDADNGKLLARRRYPAPVDIALIARHVNAVLEKRHKKPPFAV